MFRKLAALVLACSMGVVAFADDGRELRLAARAGDLAEVKRLIEAGVAVDAADGWGTTALILAAGRGTPEVVEYLLKKGADPDAREGFFGSGALDAALQNGTPDYRAAKLLLAAGARDRATALGHALESGSASLAKAAVDAGPIYAYELARLREQLPPIEGELAEIFAAVKSEADPPAPVYDAKQLAGFTGSFEAEALSMTTEVADGKLVAVIEGRRIAVSPFIDRVFRDSEGKLKLSFSGRAGTVERVIVERAGQDALQMRLADAPIRAGATDLPEFVTHPDAAPTIHWTGFRGVNRDGIGDGRETPTDFDLESGEGVAWSVGVPGLGNSSPIVWGDRVYVTTAVAAGGSTPLRTGLTGAGDEIEEESEHRWLVLAYDKSSGKQIWEREVGRAIPLTKRHFKATQANSTPVTDGKRIVAVFPTAGLACLDMDGTLKWKQELGGLNAGGFNDPGLQWGFAASPVIYKDTAILQVDIHDGGYLAAWDLESGELKWKTPRPDVAPSWSTPAIWPTPDGDELVVNASIIRGYDPRTGKELWSLSPTSVQVVASPVVGSDYVIVSSGYPPARPIYAVKPGIRGKHEIADEGDVAELAWHTPRGGAYMPTPLLYRGVLYMVHHNARIVAHDARSGEPVYQARFSAGGTMTSSPVVANGKIYQGTEEGTLYVLEAGPVYRELALHEFGEPLMATPAISEGLLLVRTPSKLIALGERPSSTIP